MYRAFLKMYRDLSRVYSTTSKAYRDLLKAYRGLPAPLLLHTWSKSQKCSIYGATDDKFCSIYGAKIKNAPSAPYMEQKSKMLHIWSRIKAFAMLFAVLAASNGTASAQQSSAGEIADTQICARYFAEAEAAYGTPQHVLWAIGMVESRKGATPWPWTLNIQGQGVYFDSKASALARLREVIARGVTNG
jgi:hypothetical protein